MRQHELDVNKISTVSADTVFEKLLDNSVLLLFVIICSIGLIYADQPSSYIVEQVVTRFFRNIILVLSLLVPVWAGMGLNFSIVVGAMSAQAALIVVLNYSITGLPGIFTAICLSAPLALALGIMTGKLFNKTKGQEMITGMILGYFANGIYQLIFMYICGTIIPIRNKAIALGEGIGINGIVTFDKSLNGALDKVLKLPLDKFLWCVIAVLAIFYIIRTIQAFKKRTEEKKHILYIFVLVIGAICLYLGKEYSKSFVMTCMFTRVPVLTVCFAVLVGAFIAFLATTKLGNDIKTVGQSMMIASASGINVDRIRIIAIVISTVIASLGQVVYLQNMGTLTTYSAADQIGTFSVAALLVGGASIKKANIGHAILGTILFHIMFVVAPIAGKNISGDAQIGEYFRVFVSYAVIALALALHAWKTSFAEQHAKK